MQAILQTAGGDEVAWTEGTHYTLTGAGEEEGGTLTVLTIPVDHTPQAGELLVIKRAVPETQLTELPLGGTLPSTTIEQMVDLLTMMVQAHSEEIARAVLLKATSQASGIEIPDPEANRFLRWDDAAQNLENADIVAGGTIGVPVPIGQGGTNATTAAGARANLGFDGASGVVATGDLANEAVTTAKIADGAVTAAKVADGVVTLPRGHISGMTLSNNGTDSDHDIDIAAGQARDDGDTEDLVLGSALTKRIDASWAVGTGNGGLDTGAVAANETYFVHVIKRTDTGVVDALFSLSATAPSMPANYDKRRRIGALLTDGSANIVPFHQLGEAFLLDVPEKDYDLADPGTATTLRSLKVPLGIVVIAIHSFSMRSSGAAAVSVQGLVTSPAVADTAPGPAIFNARLNIGSGNATSWSNEMRIRTDTSGRIRTRFDGSNGALSIAGTTMGWIDRRGQDD